MWLVLGLLAAAALSRAAEDRPRVEAAFEKFWASSSPNSAAAAANELVDAGVPFDEAWRRLKLGRTYAAQSSGVAILNNRTADGVEHYFAVNVPANYDPKRRYQVRFQLHGGAAARTGNKVYGSGAIGTLAAPQQFAEQFYVLPYAWKDAPWWSDDQLLNLDAIVDSLKRTYNIDENRVALSGVSDGAVGVYYVAMRDTTPFASFLPLNGFIIALSTKILPGDSLFPSNLRNKPLFVINGGEDKLFPVKSVEPYIYRLISGGVAIVYYPLPRATHNTEWWRSMGVDFEQFVAGNPRQPYPDKLTWDANDDVHNRAHWLVIADYDLAASPARAWGNPAPDLNILSDAEALDFPGVERELFPRPPKTGHVDLARSGNTVTINAVGVTAITLLISPDQFDFAQPITIHAGDHTVWSGRVTADVSTLLKWAARDNDRTMLFGAEITIRLVP